MLGKCYGKCPLHECLTQKDCVSGGDVEA
jgi:hypothetical protein